jgi:general secretion pathway protein D
MKSRLYILALLLLVIVTAFQPSKAEARALRGDPIVIKVVDLDHADAEHLASVLAPLLSPEGRIVAYSRTNSLIIKDRASTVKRLVGIIKGTVDQQP